MATPDFLGVVQAYTKGQRALADLEFQNNRLLENQRQFDEKEKRLKDQAEKLAAYRDSTLKLQERTATSNESRDKAAIATQNQQLANLQATQKTEEQKEAADSFRTLVGDNLTPGDGNIQNWLNSTDEFGFQRNLDGFDRFLRQYGQTIGLFQKGRRYAGVEEVPGQAGRYVIKLELEGMKNNDGSQKFGYLTEGAGSGGDEQMLIFDNNSLPQIFNAAARAVETYDPNQLGRAQASALVKQSIRLASLNAKNPEKREEIITNSMLASQALSDEPIDPRIPYGMNAQLAMDTGYPSGFVPQQDNSIAGQLERFANTEGANRSGIFRDFDEAEYSVSGEPITRKLGPDEIARLNLQNFPFEKRKWVNNRQKRKRNNPHPMMLPNGQMNPEFVKFNRFVDATDSANPYEQYLMNEDGSMAMNLDTGQPFINPEWQQWQDDAEKVVQNRQRTPLGDIPKERRETRRITDPAELSRIFGQDAPQSKAIDKSNVIDLIKADNDQMKNFNRAFGISTDRTDKKKNNALGSVGGIVGPGGVISTAQREKARQDYIKNIKKNEKALKKALGSSPTLNQIPTSGDLMTRSRRLKDDQFYNFSLGRGANDEFTTNKNLEVTRLTNAIEADQKRLSEMNNEDAKTVADRVKAARTGKGSQKEKLALQKLSNETFEAEATRMALLQNIEDMDEAKRIGAGFSAALNLSSTPAWQKGRSQKVKSAMQAIKEEPSFRNQMMMEAAELRKEYKNYEEGYDVRDLDFNAANWPWPFNFGTKVSKRLNLDIVFASIVAQKAGISRYGFVNGYAEASRSRNITGENVDKTIEFLSSPQGKQLVSQYERDGNFFGRENPAFAAIVESLLATGSARVSNDG